MIFTPENAAKVVAGTKTQTRRPAKLDDEQVVYNNKVAAVKRKGRYLWRVNDGTVDWLSIAGTRGLHGSRGGGVASYRQPTSAVQPGRGKLAVARIRILEIRHEALFTISPEDVRAEGFESFDQLGYVWEAMYGQGSFTPDVYVWALTFSLVPKEWGLGGSR